MKTTKKYKLNKKIYLNLFKKISLIRICENFIDKYYYENEMKTPMHMSKGEELVVSAAVEIFGKGAKYFGYYRSHALYLSLVGNIKNFFGEMYGKLVGENKGVTGSMHILNPKKNLMSVSAIVSSTIAPAVGHAYGSYMNNRKDITISFFGDGATEEGVFHEAMNFISLHKLPIVMICLNNNLAVDVKIEDRQSYKISQLVKSYGIKYYKIDSLEVDDVCKTYEDAKKFFIKKKEPVFIEAKYYRHLQHIGLSTDFDENNNNFERSNYRSLKEYKSSISKDPFVLIKKIIERKYTENFASQQIKSYEKKIEKTLKAIKKSQESKWKNIEKKVYYEKKK